MSGITQDLIDRINQFAFPVQGQVPAPPCEKQGKFTTGGETTDYPHVRQSPVSSADGAPRPPPVRTLLERVVRAAGRRPGRVLLAVAIVAGIAAPRSRCGSSRARRRRRSSARARTPTARPRSTATASATTRSSCSCAATSPNLVLTDNLGRLLGLEGCLSGNKPQGPGGAGRDGARRAREFARTKPVKVVYGPGTFINAAVGEINDQFAAAARQPRRRRPSAPSEAARKLAKAQGRDKAGQEKAANAAEQLVYAQFTRDLLTLNLRYGLGLKGLPRLDDPDFVSALVFDPARGATTPKARFAYLFPNQRSAVIQVRLKPDLDRGAAAAGDRARPRRGGDEGVAAQGRELHGHRRAGGGRGPRRGAHRLAAAAARRRAARDGARARVRVPQPPAAAAAGGRARGGVRSRSG